MKNISEEKIPNNAHPCDFGTLTLATIVCDYNGTLSSRRLKEAASDIALLQREGGRGRCLTVSLYNEVKNVMTHNLITLTHGKLLALVAAPSVVAIASTGYIVWRGVRDYKVRKQVQKSAQDIAELKSQISALKQSTAI